MAVDLANEVVIRWSDPDPKYASLLQEGGVTVAWGSDEPAFRGTCARLGITTMPVDAIQTCGLEEIGHARPGVPVAVTWGLWPGVQGLDADTASATRGLWMDANGFRAACLRALHPEIPPVLAYEPNAAAGLSPDRMVPFDTLELALAEAWSGGGNYVLALEPRYREALLRGDEAAKTAWRSLGRTARWLREHRSLFREPTLPIVVALADMGGVTEEINKLLYRHSVSPMFAPVTNPPPADPKRTLVLVAAGIDAPEPEIAERILAHASAGAVVVVDGVGARAWWRRDGMTPLKNQEDREFFGFGKGQVVAYRGVDDPNELALDVVDLVTQNRRPTRLWNCPGGLSVATAGPSSGPVTARAVLHVLNYARPAEFPVLARIQGNFAAATVLRPGHPPLEVRVAKRGTSSEVAIPALARVAVVAFS